MNTKPEDIENKSNPDSSAVSKYDFNHPQHRLGKPAASLTVTATKLASQMSFLVDTVLHVSCDIELVSADYQKNNELFQALDENVCVLKSAIDTQSVDALILLERDLILTLVTSYFGGSAERVQAVSKRGVSAAERRLAERLNLCIIDGMQSVWGDCFKVSSPKIPMLTAKEFTSMESEQSVVAALKYSLKSSDSESFFTVVLPWVAVKSIQHRYSAMNTNNGIENSDWCTRLQEHLEKCHVDLQGKLAETDLTVGQLFNMQVGDFIPLSDQGVATFTIDNTPVFEAEIGSSNGLVSASISRWLDQGDKHDE